MIRFLVTAPPLLFETTRPTLGGPSRPGVLTKTIPPLRCRSPASRTLRKSRGLRRDSYSGSEALSALVPTCLEGGPTGAGSHPMPESMASLAAAHLWLVSPFHNPKRVGKKRPQVTEPWFPMSKPNRGAEQSRARVAKKSPGSRKEQKTPVVGPVCPDTSPQSGNPFAYLGFCCGQIHTISSTPVILAFLTGARPAPILARLMLGSVTRFPVAVGDTTLPGGN